MEIVDEINLEEKEKFFEEVNGDLFYAMLNGKTVRETVATLRGEFVIKFPKQKDVIAIARLTAFSRSGIPAGNFDAAGDYEIQKCATLDITVESGPPWFNKLKNSPDFTWRNMPDAGFVDEVYAKALFFRQKVQAEISGNKVPSDSGTSEPVSGGVPADVGGDVFSGASSSHNGT
jgi:hypothetical protein